MLRGFIDGHQFRRLKTSSIFTKSNVFGNSIVKFQQHRSFMNNVQSKNSNNIPPTNMFSEIKSVYDRDASRALQIIEKGWKENTIPASPEIIRIYLQAAAKLNYFEKMDVNSFLRSIGRKLENGEEHVAFPSSGSFFTSNQGSSPSNPLYFQQVPKVFDWGSIAKTLAKGVVTTFLLLSFLMVVMDDKGGLGSKIGGQGGTAVHMAEKSDKKFDDVVGVDEAKSDLQEIVMYLKSPEKFTRLGGKLPKGVLLTGPPGTGKTLLARAIAGEAGVPFFYCSGSEFDEMFVGVGARRVRDLFQQANAKGPCIIFIDEIDAIGGSRQLKDQSAMKMTLNQLLVEMDGFKQNNGIIVIGATNFPESLDSALTRPGRLDKHVEVSLPDVGGRKAILDLYGTKVPLGGDVDMEQIARGTPGFSGAELANLVNEAALRASVLGLDVVTMGILEYAKDKIMMGAERVTAVITPATMKVTAFHEAGHALVSLKTSGADPIHKATIMPRGRALGMVMQLPDSDQVSMSKKQMLARLDICMGGRVAEEIVLGPENVTSGASNDFLQATRLATAMITKWGFSEKLGIQSIDTDRGKGGGAVSVETQNVIDMEVRQLLSESYARVRELITNNRSSLNSIAHALLEHETLSGAEIRDIVSGKAVDVAKRSQKPSREPVALPLPPSSSKPVARGGGEVVVNMSLKDAPPPSGPVASASSSSVVPPAVTPGVAKKAEAKKADTRMHEGMLNSLENTMRSRPMPSSEREEVLRKVQQLRKRLVEARTANSEKDIRAVMSEASDIQQSVIQKMIQSNSKPIPARDVKTGNASVSSADTKVSSPPPSSSLRGPPVVMVQKSGAAAASGGGSSGAGSSEEQRPQGQSPPPGRSS